MHQSGQQDNRIEQRYDENCRMRLDGSRRARSLAALWLVSLWFGQSAAWATDYQFVGPFWADWSVAANWSPGGGPPNSFFDSVTIDNAASVNIRNVYTIGNIDLSGGSFLHTAGGRIHVAQDTELTKTSDVPVLLSVSDDGTHVVDFDTDQLRINDGAWLRMRDGHMDIDKRLNVDPESRIYGSGLIRFTGNTANPFALNGTLEVENDSILSNGLTLFNAGSGVFDLDGFDATRSHIIVTSGSTLSVDGPVGDAFNGQMDIAGGNAVFLPVWSLGAENFWGHRGQLNMDGGLTIASSCCTGHF